jgi:hypothetical protein
MGKVLSLFASRSRETFSAIEAALSVTQSDTFVAPPTQHNLLTPEVGGWYHY